MNRTPTSILSRALRLLNPSLPRCFVRATSVICTAAVFASSAMAAIPNGDFANGLTNWTVVGATSTPSDFVNLGVTSLGGCTSVDNQDYIAIQGRKSGGAGAAPPANDNRQPTAATFTASSFTGAIDTGIVNPGNVLKLGSNMSTGAGYDVVHGPAAVSDAFTANAGDVLSFDWYAKYVSDDFAITAYLQKTDCSGTITGLVATGRTIAGMASVPAASGTGWQNATFTVATSGTYRFVFVSGTFDRSGGQAAGAELYISGVTAGTLQTITFATPATQTVGVPLTLAATASSNLAVTYQSTTSSVCTVSGSTATFLTAGTCALTARQGGDATFASAAPVNVSFTVDVGAQNGACGSANGVATAFKPTTNLCSVSLASAVTGSTSWNWTCASYGSGTTASCTAPLQNTAPGTGSGSSTVAATNGWVVDRTNSAGFIPVSGNAKSPSSPPPTGYSFPHGLFDFTLITGTAGTPATITITYPTALPAGAVYWKFGPSPAGFNCTTACATPHWYQMPPSQAVFSGNTVTLTITDGGVGDDDLLANSVIPDAGGPGVPDSGGGIPTLSEWGMIILTALLALSSLIVMRRRRL